MVEHPRTREGRSLTANLDSQGLRIKMSQIFRCPATISVYQQPKDINPIDTAQLTNPAHLPEPGMEEARFGQEESNIGSRPEA
jgi:hypothetical protein